MQEEDIKVGERVYLTDEALEMYRLLSGWDGVAVPYDKSQPWDLQLAMCKDKLLTVTATGGIIVAVRADEWKDAWLVKTSEVRRQDVLHQEETGCKCRVFISPCSCGEFKREMESKGKIYNKFLRCWE